MNISIKNLTFGYENLSIFDCFNSEFEEGKINVILGKSGVGKTTLLNAITNLIKCEGEISGVPERISYIFQKDRLVPSVSVFKNLDLILKDVNKDKQSRQNAIFEMLSRLEITEISKRLPTEISGGQARRVAIARAFLYPSKLLILDEPFKGMDVALKTKLINEFLQLWNDEKRTVIMVTHDIYEALLMGDKISVISGNPVEIVYSETISVPQKNRMLTDAPITELRDKIISKLI